MVLWSRMIFLSFFLWFILGSVVLAAEAGYYQYQANVIVGNPNDTMPQIRRVIKGYPLVFTQQETNQSNYGIISSELVGKVGQALNGTAEQLSVSSLASFLFGLAWYSFYAWQVPAKEKPEKAKNKDEEEDSRYVDSVDAVSKGVSATAPVVISVIGAVSLLTSTLNGFTLAGVQLLIITLLVGILVFPRSADLIRRRNISKGTVVLDKDVCNTWQLMTSAQFWLFILGFALVAWGMISLG